MLVTVLEWGYVECNFDKCDIWDRKDLRCPDCPFTYQIYKFMKDNRIRQIEIND